MTAAAMGSYFAVRFPDTAAGEERIQPAPRQADSANAEDEKAIRKVQAAYLKAFNAGDAKALAGFWTVDGEFVDADSQPFRGRAAIEKEFAGFFADNKGLTLQISTDSLRFVSPGVALESGSSHVARASDGAVSQAAYTIVHTKKDGQWQLASVREMPYAPASNYDHLRDLEWLVGNWKAKNGDLTLEVSCEWTGKRNFMTRKYTLTTGGKVTKTGVQVIGWDPQAGEIRSWVFDSDGGFGSERWAKDGARWLLEATAVTRSGASAAATNVLTCLDHDTFTWQSVERSLDQVRLPDTGIITVTRVKAKQ
jgi:uncharacterized protein (TIGR02246 family)